LRIGSSVAGYFLIRSKDQHAARPGDYGYFEGIFVRRARAIPALVRSLADRGGDVISRRIGEFARV